MNQKPVSLKQSIGPGLLTFYGMGTILGAGIYVLVGEVATRAGVFAPLSFALAALLALFSALSYAELAARYPFSAGEAVYVEQAFHRRWISTTVGYLAMVIGAVSSGTLVHGFANYLSVFIAVPEWVVIVCVVTGMGMVAAWGVTESLTIAAAMTVVEIFGLLLVIWVGGDYYLRSESHLRLAGPGDGFPGWAGLFGGAFIAFYAYVGFEDMVNMGEEVKKPRQNLPRAILASLVITTFFYLSVSLVVVGVFTPSELRDSTAPLASLYEKATGEAPVIISLIALFAVMNGALIQIIKVSRVLYGMARRGWAPSRFGTVGNRTRTPLLATFVVSIGVLLLSLWLPLVVLAEATSFLTLVLFALINLALIRVRRRTRDEAPVIRMPAAIPWLGFFTTTLFLVISLVGALG